MQENKFGRQKTCKLLPKGDFKQEFLTQLKTIQLRILNQKADCLKKFFTARE